MELKLLYNWHVVVGNVLAVSMVVMFSHVVLYSVNKEIDLYTQTKNGIEACTSNRLATLSLLKLNSICLSTLKYCLKKFYTILILSLHLNLPLINIYTIDTM